MNKIILVTETQIKQMSTINNNVDSNFLSSQIWYTQERFLRPLIGDDLYNQIINQYSGSTLSTDNTILYDIHIVPTLVNYTISEVLPLIACKIDNVGIHTRSDVNFQPVDNSEINRIADKYKAQGDFFAEQMVRFLHVNESKYPLFLNGNQTIDKIRPTQDGRRSQFYLGKRTFNPSKHN